MSIRKRSILVGRRLAVLLGILSLSATLLAQPAPRPRPLERGELVETHFAAQALAGNLLGDPTEQPVSIYLPPGYGSSPAKRFPTVYLLHGYAGKIRDWTIDGYQGLNLRTALDELIRTGRRSSDDRRRRERP